MTFPARAEHVDTLRLWLPKQARARGLDYICRELQLDDLAARAALRYLQSRGEIRHEEHTGYSALPLEIQPALHRTHSQRTMTNG